VSGARRGAALVRPPSDRLHDAIITHIERRPVDVNLARRQHDGYREGLTAAGWDLSEVAAAPDHPDAVFVEDTVVIVDDLAVLARPGAEQRRGEVAGVERAVRDLGLRVDRIEAPGHLDGGDVLQVGPNLYVGRGGRTDADGIRQLRAMVEPLGRNVTPVQLREVLHLKSAVTALPDGTFVGVAGLVDAAPFPTWREAPEESGCHVVPLGGGTVLMAASAPRTAQWFDDLGFEVVAVDISEYEKLEGCVTCLSVLVPATGSGA
jgi:dimethylargininase